MRAIAAIAGSNKTKVRLPFTIFLLSLDAAKFALSSLVDHLPADDGHVYSQAFESGDEHLRI